MFGLHTLINLDVKRHNEDEVVVQADLKRGLFKTGDYSMHGWPASVCQKCPELFNLNHSSASSLILNNLA